MHELAAVTVSTIRGSRHRALIHDGCGIAEPAPRVLRRRALRMARVIAIQHQNDTSDRRTASTSRRKVAQLAREKGSRSSVRDKELYEKPREDGNSKEESTRIANAAVASSRKKISRKGGKSPAYEEWSKSVQVGPGVEGQTGRSQGAIEDVEEATHRLRSSTEGPRSPGDRGPSLHSGPMFTLGRR